MVEDSRLIWTIGMMRHSPPRWLVFLVGQSGGGHADRLKGVIGTLFLAILTHRAFAIQNDNPMPWEEFYLPNVLPWIPFTHVDAALKPEKEADLHTLYYMDVSQLWAEHGNNFIDQWRDSAIVRIRNNYNTILCIAMVSTYMNYTGN